MKRVFFLILFFYVFISAVQAQENNAATSALNAVLNDTNVKKITAQYQEGRVYLNIVTNGIKSNKFYSVERSTDGNEFETIGNIKCFGTQDEFDISYSFVDNYPLFSYIYYRLVYHTFDSDSLFSQKIGVLAGTDKSNLYVTISDDIWIINQKNDKMIPLKMDFSSKEIECNVSLNPDGNTLYFISDRSGGYGGKDIWATEKLSNGNWSEPYNLGKEINTAFDEDIPIILEDGATLYFQRSKESPGITMEAFFSTQSEVGLWSKPEKLEVLKVASEEYYSNLTGTVGGKKYTYLVKKIENTSGNVTPAHKQ